MLFFLNITSKHLPLVGKFISFWNENIRCNHTEIELEIDELSTLFLNHGEAHQADALRTKIKHELNWEAEIPKLGAEYLLK